MKKAFFIKPPLLWSLPLVLQGILFFSYLPSTSLLARIPDSILEYVEWLPGVFLIVAFVFLIGFSLVAGLILSTDSPSFYSVFLTVLVCSLVWVVLVNLFYSKYPRQRDACPQESKLLWHHLILWSLINICLTIWLWKGTIDL